MGASGGRGHSTVGNWPWPRCSDDSLGFRVGKYVPDSSTHPERFHSVVEDVQAETAEDKECLLRGL